ncbi:MAG: GtrA family protein [Alphaproteobacteria bacterium]|nr:GtrA family protein [Alphaproteobacteria bacterium]
MITRVLKLYFWAEDIWFSLPEKLRFLLVGGFNTVFAYGILSLLVYCFENINTSLGWNIAPAIIANIALVIQYIITINVSFITMKYYVFRSRGNWLSEWFKAWSVYIFIYLINAPTLTLLMVVFSLSAYPAQAIYLTFSTIITFILHKYYSFRSKE